ncbi:MAG: glycosyltransferase [Candidatus Omnitrophota bacterium]|nr:glycosyltransferase [Candidatus Omnitrophota bacterium]
MEISVIILTKDEEKYIGSALEMVFRQEVDGDYEVIVIDSGSRDATLEIVRHYPARIVKIKPEEFGHSRTRNLGVQLSKGAYVVFLTADAVPANNTWLKNLILPFKQNTDVAGVYSRQIPKRGCYPSEARDILVGTGLIPRVKSINLGDPDQAGYFNKNVWKFITFSNISSAYRRDLLEQYPFAEDLLAVEDQEWVYRLIKNGYSIYYEPTSCVYHSHNDTLKKLYDRHNLFGLSFKEFVKDKSRGTCYYFIKITIYEIIMDYIFLLNYAQGLIKKTVWFFKIPLFRIIKNFAFYQGFKNGTPRH